MKAFKEASMKASTAAIASTKASTEASIASIASMEASIEDFMTSTQKAIFRRPDVPLRTWLKGGVEQNVHG